MLTNSTNNNTLTQSINSTKNLSNLFKKNNFVNRENEFVNSNNEKKLNIKYEQYKQTQNG